jgi:hypothetical protein
MVAVFNSKVQLVGFEIFDDTIEANILDLKDRTDYER